MNSAKLHRRKGPAWKTGTTVQLEYELPLINKEQAWTEMKYATFRAGNTQQRGKSSWRGGTEWQKEGVAGAGGGASGRGGRAGRCWCAGGQVGRAWPRAQAVTVTRSDTPSPPASQTGSPRSLRAFESSYLWLLISVDLKKKRRWKKKTTASFHQFCKANNVLNRSQQGASSHFLGDDTSRYTCLMEIAATPCSFESLQWIFF